MSDGAVMRKLTCLILILMGGGLAAATCPQAILKIVVQEPVVAAPAYGAGYNASDDLLRRILEALERIENKLDGQALQNLDFAKVVANRCASCHTAGKKNESKLTLMEADGKTISPLSVEQKKLIKLLIETTDEKIRMPKGRILNDAEKQAILSGL